MHIQLNDSESWDISFPEVASAEEARVFARYILERLDVLTSSKISSNISKKDKKEDERKPILYIKKGRGKIKSREHALQLFKIYYNPKLSSNEKVTQLIKEGIKFQAFQSSSTHIRKRWGITTKDIKQIKSEFKQAQNPVPQVEVKKNEESLTSSVNNNNKTADAKDFADEFEKW